MSDPAETPPSIEPAWYVAVGDQRLGPMGWAELVDRARAGQLAPGQYVWAEGMDQWQPAASVPGLLAGPMPAVGYAVQNAQTVERLRTARRVCIGLFVVLVATGAIIVALGLVGSMMASSTSAPPSPVMIALGCTFYIGPLTGIFAAIYFPLRWRVIMALPTAPKVLGLIGGFGLMASTALMLVGLVIGLVMVFL